MDLSKKISYNSLTVNGVMSPTAAGTPMSGYVVDEINVSSVDVAQYVDKRALHDGVDAQDVYLGARTISGIVTAYGSSAGDFWDKAQGFLAGFSPTLGYAADTANIGFLPFDFYQPTADLATWPTLTYPSGIPLRYYCRPSAPPHYAITRDDQGGAAALGLAKPLRFSLVARDPRKYLQTSTVVAITTATQTAVYRGDYPTFPIVAFHISAAGHSAFTVTIDGGVVVLNLSAASVGTYTLDYATGSLTDTNGASKASLITSVTRLSTIKSGSTFVMANATSVTSCTLTYREAFA